MEESKSYDYESHNKIIKCYWVLGISAGISLAIFISFLVMSAVLMTDGKGGNGRNVGISYVRKYYPPLTSKN